MALCSLLACSATDETATDRQERTAVSADLSLTVSTVSQGGESRSSAVTTQNADGSFRGLQNVLLIPFTVKGRPVDFGDGPLTPFTIDADNAFTATGSNHYLQESMQLLTGTASFLCYGHANKATDSDDAFQNGAITADYDDYAPENITFSPVLIADDDAAKKNSIANYLNAIAKAGDWYLSADPALRSIFEEFTNKGDGTYSGFAGSSANIKVLVNRLYAKFHDEVAAGTVRSAVLEAIADDSYVDFNTSALEVSELRAGNFPTVLPEGSAVVRWDPAVSEFSYQATANKYVYPVELYYYANSEIQTSLESRQPVFANSKSWSSILSSYNDGDEVAAGTQSVAIRQPLNYGVGCLKTVIGIDLYNGTGLLDADRDPSDLITLTAGTFPLTAILVGGQHKQNYSLSPLYPDEMAAGYSADDDTEYIIYDKSVAGDGICLGDIANGSMAEPIYTLALQTKNDKSVKMVMEFMNNSGREFRCESGIIYPGTKFYMMASIVSPMASEDYQKRIFTKDYVTTARLTISSLATAYNALPDLNSDKVRLFSVVEAAVAGWTDGMNDDHVFYNW